MKFNDLKEKNINELNSILLDLKKEAFNLRFHQKVSGNLPNPSRKKIIRKSIARVLTLLNNKILGKNNA